MKFQELNCFCVSFKKIRTISQSFCFRLPLFLCELCQVLCCPVVKSPLLLRWLLDEKILLATRMFGTLSLWAWAPDNVFALQSPGFAINLLCQFCPHENNLAFSLNLALCPALVLCCRQSRGKFRSAVWEQTSSNSITLKKITFFALLQTIFSKLCLLKDTRSRHLYGMNKKLNMMQIQ